MEVLRNSQKFGYCGMGTQNSQTFPAGTKSAVFVPLVLWYGAYRNPKSSGYGYKRPAQLTEAPGTGMKVVQNFQVFRILRHGRTELAEVLGRYKIALPVPRVFVELAYRAYIQKFRVRV